MVGETRGAQGVAHAVQTVHIALTLVGDAVDAAGDEEARLQQGLQPWRPVVVVTHSNNRPPLREPQAIHINRCASERGRRWKGRTGYPLTITFFCFVLKKSILRWLSIASSVGSEVARAYHGSIAEPKAGAKAAQMESEAATGSATGSPGNRQRGGEAGGKEAGRESWSF